MNGFLVTGIIGRIRRFIHRLPFTFHPLLIVIAGCNGSLDSAFSSASLHEQYASSLEDAGLDATELGSAWLEAGKESVREPVAIELPFRETGYIPDTQPGARGFRFAGQEGQVLVIELDSLGTGAPRIFLDLFIASADSGRAPERIAGLDSGEYRLKVELEEDADYIIRLQTELLRSLGYTITIRTIPSLAFPVSGEDTRAVQSRFGDPRDGGSRSHAGIDIFAERGTPVVAATGGRVGRTGTNQLGGKVVWLRDAERSQSLYYAHLDSQLVEPGEEVERGDTLGLVGNTGNARTTPPHLHFGIYRPGEGAVDPWPWVHVPVEEPPLVRADTTAVGKVLRTGSSEVVLEESSSPGDPLKLEPYTPVRVLGAVGNGYRVRLPGGRQGIVPSGQVTELEPVRQISPPPGTPILDAPGISGMVMDTTTGGRIAEVARYGDWSMVEQGGWIYNGER